MGVARATEEFQEQKLHLCILSTISADVLEKKDHKLYKSDEAFKIKHSGGGGFIIVIIKKKSVLDRKGQKCTLRWLVCLNK